MNCCLPSYLKINVLIHQQVFMQVWKKGMCTVQYLGFQLLAGVSLFMCSFRGFFFKKTPDIMFLNIISSPNSFWSHHLPLQTELKKAAVQNQTSSTPWILNWFSVWISWSRCCSINDCLGDIADVVYRLAAPKTTGEILKASQLGVRETFHLGKPGHGAQTFHLWALSTTLFLEVGGWVGWLVG